MERPAGEARTAPPRRRVSNVPARTLAAHAVTAIQEKKGHDISVMDMRELTGVADYFVVCTGDSDIQVKAIADAIRDRIEDEFGERPWHVEGYSHFQWVLLDYVDLVVHVFDRERRSFYHLERLWADAPIEHVSEMATSVAMLEEPGTDEPPRSAGRGG